MSTLEESWVQDHIEEVYNDTNLGSLPDTFLWAKALRNILENDEINEYMGIEPIQGVLLTGPYGSGKNTMATAIVGEVPYQYICLNGQAMDDEAEMLVMQKLEQIFQYLESAQDRLCVWLEHMEMSRHVKKIYDYMAARFEEILWDEKVFFIIVENDEKIVPDIFKRNLFHCYLQLPDQEDREEFLESKLSNADCLVTILDMQLSDLALMTDGFTYKQLEVLVTLLKMQLKENALHECDYILKESLQKIKDGSVYLKTEQVRKIIRMVRKRSERVVYMPGEWSHAAEMSASQTEADKNRQNTVKKTKTEQSYKEHLDDLIRRKHTLNMLSETGAQMVREKLGQE